MQNKDLMLTAYKSSDVSIKHFLKQWERLSLSRGTQYSISLLAIPLAACGGGGGGYGGSEGSVNTSTTSSTSTTASSTTGGATISAAPSSTLMSLAKTGSSYTSSEYNGISLVGSGAHLRVSDDTRDNQYDLKLTAQGTGELHFDFDDAADTITLLDGSTIDGFSQVTVSNGTVDATAADLGVIDKIVVASGIKVSFAQLTSIKSIVTNSAESSIEIAVASDAEAEALQAFLESGSISMNIAGGEGALKVAEAPAAVVTPAVLTTVAGAAGGVAAAAPAPTPAVLAPPAPATVLATQTSAVLKLMGDDAYVSAAEASSTVKFKVDLSNSYTVKSLTIGGVSASATGVSGEYQVNASSLREGANTVSLVVQDPSGILFGGAQDGLVTLTGTVYLDTAAPEAVINIEGASNGLNNAEARSNVGVTVSVVGDARVSELAFEGSALSPNANGTYQLDASTLADGDYSITASLIDTAGNVATVTESFTVNTSAPSEPTIEISAAANGLNATELASPVSVQIDLNGAASLVSVKLGDSDLNSAGGAYSMDASQLSDGTHYVDVVALDADGTQIASREAFIVDTIAPAAPVISVPGAQFGLTPNEVVNPVTVFVSSEIGSTVDGVTLNGSALSKTGEGSYSFNGATLSAGRYDLGVSVSDLAGNTTTVSENITILGTTNSITSAFDLVSTTTNGVMSVDMFIKNALDQFPNGIPSYDFILRLNPDHLDFVEGSFVGFEGSTSGVTSLSASPGAFDVSGTAGGVFKDYTQPFFQFEAAVIGDVETTQIRMQDLLLYTTDFGNVDFYTSV